MNQYQLGKQLVSNFYALTRVLLVYEPNNEVVQNTAQKMIDYMKDSQAELLRYREYVFLNKERLRDSIWLAEEKRLLELFEKTSPVYSDYLLLLSGRSKVEERIAKMEETIEGAIENCFTEIICWWVEF